MKPLHDKFEGIVLEKCVDMDGDLVFFEEQKEELVYSDAVLSLVISINEVSCTRYSVERNEYDQLTMLVE